MLKSDFDCPACKVPFSTAANQIYCLYCNYRNTLRVVNRMGDGVSTRFAVTPYTSSTVLGSNVRDYKIKQSCYSTELWLESPPANGEIVTITYVV